MTTNGKVTMANVRDMTNEMPLALLCILAHQSDRQYLTREETKALLALFPDAKFESIKKAIQSDQELKERFIVCMLYRFSRARRIVNYTILTIGVKVDGGDGWVWTYGERNPVFRAPDGFTREMAEANLRAH